MSRTGATGVVTALHEVPNGEPWTKEAIADRKALIETSGLHWSVVESVPVHQDIKRGGPLRDQCIAAYQGSLRNLAANGIDVVLYNFMPILDWTRTDPRYVLANGAWALRFDQDAFAAFDLFILARAGAAAEYDQAGLPAPGRTRTTCPRRVGNYSYATSLPRCRARRRSTLEFLREMLATYADIDADALRVNLGHFLRAVVPVAEEVGVPLSIHPSEPPRPLLGLPRVVSTAGGRPVVARCSAKVRRTG